MTILTLRGRLITAGDDRDVREYGVGGIRRCRRTVARWIARSRQRRALREIAQRTDDHLLKDIGVSREEAFREADKPFWRP
jgi:uncharacterized protein YjiS (DUF1127 family)